MKKRHFLAALAASALALPAAPAALAQSVASGPVQTIAGTRLDVSARGTVTRVPDLATVTAGVVTQAATADAAMRENAQRMAAVLAALKKAGIADRDVATASINLSPQYRYGENQPPVITGYQASNNVSVRFRDLSRAGAVLDALVKEGANQINGPTLSIEKPEAALDEARRAAIRSARAQADLYASAVGLKIKRIVTITESSDSSPRPPVLYARAQSAEAADTKIMAGEQDVGVTVAITYELE